MFENIDLEAFVNNIAATFDQYIHYILHIYNINVNNMVDAMFIFWLISTVFQKIVTILLIPIGG